MKPDYSSVKTPEPRAAPEQLLAKSHSEDTISKYPGPTTLTARPDFTPPFTFNEVEAQIEQRENGF